MWLASCWTSVASFFSVPWSTRWPTRSQAKKRWQRWVLRCVRSWPARRWCGGVGAVEGGGVCNNGSATALTKPVQAWHPWRPLHLLPLSPSGGMRPFALSPWWTVWAGSAGAPLSGSTRLRPETDKSHSCAEGTDGWTEWQKRTAEEGGDDKGETDRWMDGVGFGERCSPFVLTHSPLAFVCVRSPLSFFFYSFFFFSNLFPQTVIPTTLFFFLSKRRGPLQRENQLFCNCIIRSTTGP